MIIDYYSVPCIPFGDCNGTTTHAIDPSHELYIISQIDFALMLIKLNRGLVCHFLGVLRTRIVHYCAWTGIVIEASAFRHGSSAIMIWLWPILLGEINVTISFRFHRHLQNFDDWILNWWLVQQDCYLRQWVIAFDAWINCSLSPFCRSSERKPKMEPQPLDK